MGRKHKPEEIISKLREADIVLAQDGTVAEAVPGLVLRSRATTAGARNTVFRG